MPKLIHQSPLKTVSSGNKSLDSDVYIVPDLHGCFLTLIRQLEQVIPSFGWETNFFEKYDAASALAHSQISNLLSNNKNSYPVNHVEHLKTNNQTDYEALEGDQFVQMLKQDLSELKIDEVDKQKEIIFAGDLLADRKTNTLYMLYAFKAIQKVGVNFKIIFSNHDEVFFNVYAQLKQKYDLLDKNQLQDLDYVKSNFILPLRDVISSEINRGFQFTFCYVSLLQFAFTIEKQIYDIHSRNELSDSSEKASLLNEFVEVVDIIENIYMPNLKLAYLKDLETSNGEKRSYLTTHAPQGLLSLVEVAKSVDKTLNKNDVSTKELREIYNILSIYAPHDLDCHEEIEYLVSLINKIEKNNTSETNHLKSFIQTNYEYPDLDLVDANQVRKIAKVIILEKTSWFAQRILYLPIWINEFHKKKTQLIPSFQHFDQTMAEVTHYLFFISEHFLFTKKQIFKTNSMQSLKNIFKDGYVNLFYQLCHDLKVLHTLKDKQDHHQNELSVILDRLYQYLSTNDRYRVSNRNKMLFSNLKESVEKLKYSIEKLDALNLKEDFVEHADFKAVCDFVQPVAMQQEKLELEGLIKEKNPEVINFLQSFCAKLIQEQCIVYKQTVFEMAQDVLIAKLADPVLTCSKVHNQELPTSLFELWENMVAHAITQLKNRKSQDTNMISTLRTMYLNTVPYKKTLYNSMIGSSLESNSRDIINLNKVMTENLDYIISKFPEIILERGNYGDKTLIQEKISEFVWSRYEITGDKSGRFPMVFVYAHTGNADVEQKDCRIVYVSLDNFQSKLNSNAIRVILSGRRCDSTTYNNPTKPTSVCRSPSIFHQSKRKSEQVDHIEDGVNKQMRNK